MRRIVTRKASYCSYYSREPVATKATTSLVRFYIFLLHASEKEEEVTLEDKRRKEESGVFEIDIIKELRRMQRELQTE